VSLDTLELGRPDRSVGRFILFPHNRYIPHFHHSRAATTEH
jgi:hypothetical protein